MVRMQPRRWEAMRHALPAPGVHPCIARCSRCRAAGLLATGLYPVSQVCLAGTLCIQWRNNTFSLPLL